MSPIDISEVDPELTIADAIPPRISEAMKKPDWKDRLKGFQELVKWMSTNREKVNSMIIPLTLWLKNKLKDFKENNQAIIKEAFTIITYLVESPNANKKLGDILIPGVLEKMGDTKWYDSGVQIILSLSNSSGAIFTIDKVIKKINASTKNVNLVKAALSLLVCIIDKNDVNQLPFIDIVECAKQSLNNSNSVIRSAATSVLCSIYKVMGEPLIQLLSDLKDATLKAVDM